MSLRSVVAFGLLGLGLVSAHSQCQIKITRMATCNASGTLATPKLGDSVYGLRVEWTVTGRAKAAYSVKFSMADKTWIWANVNATSAGNYYGYATFAMPLGGTIGTSVVVDPYAKSGNTTVSAASASGSFTPTPPSAVISYYSPLTWTASQNMTVKVVPGSNIQLISYMFGQPTTDTFQKVITNTGFPGMTAVTTTPFSYPIIRESVVFPPAQTMSFTRTFTAQSSSVAGNLQTAMGSWSKYTGLPATITPYLQAETIVQSTSSQVEAFVKAALPANYKTSMTPYQAAKTLFLAVSSKLTYRTPAPDDAISALTLKYGDCGTFTSLYDAALRVIGIPARCDCGWRVGQDIWHCWSEIYVPGAGWMPQDVTDCNSNQAGSTAPGTYAYCFDVLPDLNSRVAVSRGSTFTTNQGTWTTMQLGQWGVWGTNVTFPTWSTSCSLVAKN